MKPRHPADHHPLLGALDDAGSVTGLYSPEDAGLVEIPIPKAPLTAPVSYCDHCGYVGGHAPDCPELVSATVAREERLDQLVEEAERRSSVRYLLRQAAAAALRRLARRVAGE